MHSSHAHSGVVQRSTSTVGAAPPSVGHRARRVALARWARVGQVCVACSERDEVLGDERHRAREHAAIEGHEVRRARHDQVGARRVVDERAHAVHVRTDRPVSTHRGQSLERRTGHPRAITEGVWEAEALRVCGRLWRVTRC